jgi:hypothetical protein
MNSRSVLAFTAGLITSTLLAAAAKVIGAKSRTGSYDAFLYITLLSASVLGTNSSV